MDHLTWDFVIPTAALLTILAMVLVRYQNKLMDATLELYKLRHRNSTFEELIKTPLPDNLVLVRHSDQGLELINTDIYPAKGA